MNYTELELGGKKRGAKLGIGFLKNVTDAKNISLDELFKSIEGSNALLIVPELIYYSLAYNAKRKNESFEYSIDDIFEWIDEAGGVSSDVYQNFLNAFTQSLGADLGKEKPQKKVAK